MIDYDTGPRPGAPEGIADVTEGSTPRTARAECPSCGWHGRNRGWFSDATADANRHNERKHGVDRALVPASPEGGEQRG